MIHIFNFTKSQIFYDVIDLEKYSLNDSNNFINVGGNEINKSIFSPNPNSPSLIDNSQLSIYFNKSEFGNLFFLESELIL